MNSRSAAKTRGRRTGLLLIVLILFGFTGGVAVCAQEDHQENRLDRDFLDRFGRDFTDVIASPAHWGRRDFTTLAAVSGTGLLFIAFDQEIQEWTQDRRTESSDRASSFFTLFGDGAALLGLSAAVYAAGEIGKDDGLRKTALLSLESLTTASLLVWTIKIMTGRARPYTDESSGSYHPFSLQSRYWSFPSGHAAAAFSVATTIALQSRRALVDIAAYTFAGLAALARVHDNKHWASDVFIGSALGYFVAKKIAALNRGGEKRAISLGFVSCPGRQALILKIAF